MDRWSSLVAKVSTLVGSKQYPAALKLLRAAMREDSDNFWVRHQLADTLVLAGRTAEALPILDELAEAYARQGFHAKAIAVLKRRQRLDPSDSHRQDDRIAAMLNASTPKTDFQAALKRPQETRLGRLLAAAEGAAPGPAPANGESLEPAAGTLATPPRGLTRSPLFADFSAQQLVALIATLELVTAQPGDIIVSEGEPGGSLFVLAAGRVRVWARDGSGRNRLVRTLEEGEFFGEVSLVTGRPRTATVVAATPCELLELHGANLQTLGAQHPQIPLIIREFCDRRVASQEERAARGEVRP